jgi:hypothetical protein
MMIMNAILAVALGLAPVKTAQEVQAIRINPADYAGLIGRYNQSTDRNGTTHLTGFDRVSGRPFDIAVAKDGRVEGTVGNILVTFSVSDRA